MKNIKQYYKELGKLLYAISIADGVVQQEERDQLHQYVTKELAHNEKTYDSSGMNQAFYVDFEFEDLIKQHPELNGTVKTFKRFLENNLEPGDRELMRRSLVLMEGVTNAYTKKKEKNIIEQVKSVTDNILNSKN
jgi:hypothetical protein